METRGFSIFFLLLVIVSLLGGCKARDVLYSGETLSAGQSLQSGVYRFTMQNDCNLVLYDNNRAVWATGTNGRGTNCNCRMQRDGNLVVYTGSGAAVWASNTNIGNGNYYCILQKDRNVVVYKGSGGAIWASGTNLRGVPVTLEPNSNKTTAVAGGVVTTKG